VPIVRNESVEIEITEEEKRKRVLSLSNSRKVSEKKNGENFLKIVFVIIEA